MREGEGFIRDIQLHLDWFALFVFKKNRVVIKVIGSFYWGISLP
jgi:hypothetical protein